MNILLISSEDTTAQQIVDLCSTRQAGFHRVQAVRDPVQQVALHAEAIKNADLLIVNSANLTVEDVAELETVLEGAPRASCMLVSPSLSSAVLTRAMRAGIRYVLPTPLDAARFYEDLALVVNKSQQEGQRAGRVVSFLSCKGGSGTTFIAANLAFAHAVASNQRVLLIDLNQQYADAHLYLSENKPSTTLVDLCERVDRLDLALFDASVIKVHANFDLIAGAGDPAGAGEIQVEQFEQLLSLACQQYDMVFVDLGQNIDSLSMVALDQSEVLIPVLQSSLAHLFAGKRLVEILLSLGYQKHQLVVLINQYDSKSAPITLDTFKEKLGVSELHPLPSDVKLVNQAVAKAMPLQQVSNSGSLVKSLNTLAQQLWPQSAAPVAKRGLRGLFKSK